MSTPATGGGGMPLVRLEVIGQAWELYKRQLGTWAIISLILVLAVTAASVATDRVASLLGFSALWAPPRIMLSMLNSAMGYTMLGMALHIAVRHARGDTPSLDRLSEVLPKIGKLFIASLVMGVINTVGFVLCILPGLVTSGLLMFTLPLVVDQDAEPVEAVQRSFAMLKTQWLTAALFHLVASFLGAVGVLGCGVGLIFTLPLYLLSVALQYVQFTQTGGETLQG